MSAKEGERTLCFEVAPDANKVQVKQAVVGKYGPPGIVSRQESDQDVGVNCAHEPVARVAGFPLSCH